MHRVSLRRAFVLLALIPSVTTAQSKPQTPARMSPVAGVTDSARLGYDPALRGMNWRLAGPFRGGRAVAVAGDPNHREVFFFGGVDGGVWKTVNGGQTWNNITDGKATFASVGAIALAPSDPNVIWVGTGETDWREDLTHGDGVWRSTDGGESWQHLGLEDTRHIGVIRVDPNNPDVAYVAAMGHAFGPNPMRGVFRTSDGGRSWKKVLYLDENTGAADLAMDPSNPRILYAAMWRARRSPWGLDAGGGRSGLWKTIDGGDSWTELSGNAGLPSTPLGRIGISVSPAQTQRLYASVEAPDSAGGIFRSDNGGRTWTRTNGDQEFRVRAWYYSLLTADPVDPNTVYVMNLGVMRSIDGGRTFQFIGVPHGDTHIMWIDPKDPRRMINGNDGGAQVSFDAGASWSSVYTQPTAQFYHVTTDSRFPYRILGSQQDNSSVSIASRSDNGAIGLRDFWPVGGGESGYIAVKADDPNIVIGSSYMGTVTRYDERTQQVRDISLGMNNWDGFAVKDVPYRFAWTFPILYSPHDPKRLYVTGQKVYLTTDEGRSWKPISPDLTVHDPATMGPSGGPITLDMTGTEWYATVFTFAESPVKAGVLWAGSDDGLLHVSQDAGASWQNVTPPGLGKFTKMSIVEPSHYDPAVAYLAANRYQQDDYRPYLFKTADYGKTWKPIVAGLPENDFTRTIREDPVRRGLLFAGTEAGAWVSFDDGGRWQSLQLNLPHASVRDLTIHGADLIAATHGRSFWTLDDISPLRQITDSVRRAGAFLLSPTPALRYPGGRFRPTNAAPNPPSGLILDYWLRSRPADPIKLTLIDPAGKEIRSFTSTGNKPDSTVTDSVVKARLSVREREQNDSAFYEPADSVMGARAGANRFIWDLRYPGAKALPGIVLDEGFPDGPVAAPGKYTARLVVGHDTLTRAFTVVPDPRLGASAADYAAQFAFVSQVRDAIDTISHSVQQIETVQRQLDQRVDQTSTAPYAARVADAAKALRAKLEVVRGDLAEVNSHAYEITLHYPVKLYNQFLTLNAMAQGSDDPPTTGMLASYEDLLRQVRVQTSKLGELEAKDLGAFNALLSELKVPGVSAPPIKPPLIP
jgi:photosystem II stability/assembly factor-like uncharacterized protein